MAVALTPSYEAWITLNEARAAEQRPDLWCLGHVDRVARGIFDWLVGGPGLRADPPPVAQAAHDFLRVEGWHPFGPPQDRVWVPCDGGNPLATAKALALAEREFTSAWYGAVAQATDEQERAWKEAMARQALERERDMRRGRHRRGRVRRRRKR